MWCNINNEDNYGNKLHENSIFCLIALLLMWSFMIFPIYAWYVIWYSLGSRFIFFTVTKGWKRQGEKELRETAKGSSSLKTWFQSSSQKTDKSLPKYLRSLFVSISLNKVVKVKLDYMCIVSISSNQCFIHKKHVCICVFEVPFYAKYWATAPVCVCA